MAISMSPDTCAEEFARLLTAQAEICRLILEKSRQQQKLVEDVREDELLVLLDEKQALIAKHQDLLRKSQPIREQWENAARITASPAAHEKVETAWNQLTGVLDEIVRLEDASRAMLEEAKGKVSSDINKLQRGKIVNKAYGGGGFRPPPTARFSDKQG